MEFNRLLLQSKESFGDASKKTQFLKGLNIELQKSLATVDGDLGFESFVNKAIRTSDNLYRVNLASRSAKAPSYLPAAQSTQDRPPTPENQRMDWQPIVSNQGNTEKPRAKWVSKEEIQRRRANRLCIRCGTNAHYYQSCPYKPALRPTLPVQAATAIASPQIPPLLEDNTSIEPQSENE